jgi:hypothetical protein
MDFIFESYAFDAKTGVLKLGYAYSDGTKFTETLTFPTPVPAHNAEAADRLFRLLLLMSGVSYYKAKMPERLICKAFKMDIATSTWMKKVYALGLAEFAFKNNVKLNLQFEQGLAAPPKPLELNLPNKILIPVGGGKDSIVTLEMLRDMNPTLFAVGGPGGAAQPIADTIKVAGMPSVYVSRVLSPNLMEMNAAGALNGHVPITGIISVIALCCAVLYGFDTVVMSNEASASASNFDGVNHQYSKSFEFELALDDWVKTHVGPGLRYLSFLRPVTEVAIARKFTRMSQYHNVFRSCNTAFKQDEAARGTKWCCNCPKCRFVFLVLAPFMDKQNLIDIFGKNMLDDSTQLKGYEELTGVSGVKPFECVGEIEESAATIERLASMRYWQDDIVVEFIQRKISSPDFEFLFRLNSKHALPFPYLERLDADKKPPRR